MFHALFGLLCMYNFILKNNAEKEKDNSQEERNKYEQGMGLDLNPSLPASNAKSKVIRLPTPSKILGVFCWKSS